jgi:hypothetical protein
MLLRGGGGATDSGLRVLELLAVDVDSLCLLLPQVLLSHLHIHSTIVSVLSSELRHLAVHFGRAGGEAETRDTLASCNKNQPSHLLNRLQCSAGSAINRYLVCTVCRVYGFLDTGL